MGDACPQGRAQYELPGTQAALAALELGPQHGSALVVRSGRYSAPKLGIQACRRRRVVVLGELEVGKGLVAPRHTLIKASHAAAFAAVAFRSP